MRPLRSLFSAAVLLPAFLLSATSMAGQQTGCTTGPAIVKDTTNSPRTSICTGDYNYCCTTGNRWDLKCVEKADDAGMAGLCGRDAWTAIQIPNTQQYFPRDFNVVALDGWIMGIVDVDDPIAASAWVTAKSFSLNRLQREPYAVLANTVSLCSGTVSGNVSHSSASGSYSDTCAQGGVTYNPNTTPPTFTHKPNITDLINFSTARTNMVNMSAALSSYENPITIVDKDKISTTLTFTGKDPEVNVFSVSAKYLKGTTTYVFDLPNASASVIVNIIPEAVPSPGKGLSLMSIANASISSSIGGKLGKMAAGNLLWHIPAALGMSNLTISSTGFVGSLLAPNTTLTLFSTSVLGTLVAASVQLTYSEPHSAPYHVPASQLALAKQYIKHVVVIMQENRSFDNYFGTFPGANGIPTTGQDAINTKANCDLSKDPATGAVKCACTVNANGTYAPFHNRIFADPNFPHMNPNFITDVKKPTSGTALEAANFLATACKSGQDGNHNTELDLKQALGYYTDAEIPNYWSFAKGFVLQDRMFAAAPSWSPVAHTYMVSGWNARDCDTDTGCVGAVDKTWPTSTGRFLWNDITNLFAKDNVSWRFYKGENWAPNCSTCASSPKDCFKASDAIAGFWNPYNQTAGENSFQTVVDNQQTGNVMDLKDFFEQAEASDKTDGSNFPQVSWIVPGFAVSEHANGSYPNNTVDIRNGQAYVTSIVNAIMSHRTLWATTAIFLSWDDWGGLYDHVTPDVAYTGDTYGFRVPGLLITPWAKAGTIDPQTLSHDAYLKLMEDLFLGKKRIGPSTGKVSTKDNRKEQQQRDNSPALGDLVKEFDFSHTPLSRLSLPCNVK